MKVVSVNIGLPKTISWRGREIETGIFKEAVPGPHVVRTLNLDGDRQADLRVHGGPFKAVYGYATEHYPFWCEFLEVEKLPFGAMGENLSCRGITEDDLNIGDVLRIGTTVLMVAQPRVPCYKMQAKFDRPDIVRHFLESGRSGFYFSVVQEGSLEAGDEVELLSRDPYNVTISDMNRIQRGDADVDEDLMQRALEAGGLPEQWRDALRNALG